MSAKDVLKDGLSAATGGGCGIGAPDPDKPPC
jgi:hypothetical protein